METKPSPMICSFYNELRLEGKLCDVLIQASGVAFKAHKIVLCRCSPYFRVLFTSHWTSEQKIYDIPGVSPDIMGIILEYAYTWKARINADNVVNLIIAADYLNSVDLVEIGADFLMNQLCPVNSIGIYKFTDYYYCPALRRKTYMYILHHFEDIIKTSEEFLDLSASDLKSLIEKEELNVRLEETVCDAIMKWINHNPASRRRYISFLLPEVCPPHFAFETLTSRPRIPHSILLATGGISGGGPTNAIESYDKRADKWLNVTCETENPRAYHGAAYLRGYLYITGGSDGVAYLNSVKRFNPMIKTWQEVAPMHSKRGCVSVTILNESIYAMGGYDGLFCLNTAERYEPETNQWSLIAPMNERRSDASATTLNNKIYICGGFNGNDCLFTAEMYNLDTKQWSMITPMMTGRSGLGVIAYGEKVYAVGGFDGTHYLSSAEAYSPDDDAWRAVPSMYSAKGNFGIEVLDHLLFVIGGVDGFTNTMAAECYNQMTNEWYKTHGMSISRSALSCCVVSGLANIRDYIPSRNLPSRDEIRASSSSSFLPS